MSDASKKIDPLAHLRILTMREVAELTTYTPQHIYRLIAANRFPRPLRLGANKIGFPVSVIEAWFASKTQSTPRSIQTSAEGSAEF